TSPASFLCSFTHPPPSHTYTLSLHDALPIFEPPEQHVAGVEVPAVLNGRVGKRLGAPLGVERCTHRVVVALDLAALDPVDDPMRSEEHTSELQSLAYLVCRLLLEKKNSKQVTLIKGLPCAACEGTALHAGSAVGPDPPRVPLGLDAETSRVRRRAL